MNTQFLEIVQEIEGDTSLVSWTTNERLTRPTFLESIHLSQNSADHKTSTPQIRSNDTNNSTEAEESRSDDKGVQTVMCGTSTDEEQIDEAMLTVVLPVKSMEDVGCQVSFSGDDDSGSHKIQFFTVAMGDTENEKQVDSHSDEIGLPVSREYASETSSVTSGEQLECPDIPASVVLTQKEVTTVKASSPVHSVKMISSLPPSSTPLRQPSGVHAESINIECLKGDTRLRLSHDSSLFDVTQVSSTWPSDDSGHTNSFSDINTWCLCVHVHFIGEIDQMEDRATLEKKREELALELVWIRQAIESRKQVICLRMIISTK